MRRLIKKRRLREMSWAFVFAYAEHPYRPPGQRVLRVLHLHDFQFDEHPYRAGSALPVFLNLFIKGLTSGKS